MKFKFGTLLLCLAFLLKAALTSANTPVDVQYQLAIEDAVIVTSEKVTDRLWEIVPENKNLIWNEEKTKLVAVLWMERKNYMKHIKFRTRVYDDYEIYKYWVTVAPQVKDFLIFLTWL